MATNAARHIAARAIVTANRLAHERQKVVKVNWVVIPALNCLGLTQKAVGSALSQTIPTKVWLVNQGSTDGTARWARQQDYSRLVVTHHYPMHRALADAWNTALRRLFREVDHVLVTNNDVVLRPDAYERLLSHSKSAHREFVTGVSVDDCEQVMESQVREDWRSENAHPDFSCFLITKHCFEHVGPFDSHMIPCYREDWDYHRRMKLAGIEAACIDVPFLHYVSGTIRENQEAREQVSKWSDFRRRYYIEKWGALWPNERYVRPFGGKTHACDVCRIGGL